MATVTRGAWAKRFCNEREMDATRHRRNAVVAWETAEGTPARFNPLATTWPMPHDSMFNTTGVRNYASLKDGLHATWETLEHGESKYGYAQIMRKLEANAPAIEVLQAVAASAWGTGWLAIQVLPYVQENYDRYASKPIGQ